MKTTRRFVLKVLAGSLAAPYVLPSRVWAAPKPSGRLTMGFVGLGYQARGLLGGFQHRTQVLAICEVDTTRRKDAQANVDKFYKSTSGSCAGYTDYRELMERKDIDAVCIATPDHWHATVTLAALKSGKDVYCEKPLTHNIQEAVDVIRGVDANKRVLQTGSMQRSMREFRVACELVQNGCIGKVERVECDFGGPPRPCNLPEEKMEPGLEWNVWLGPAPLRPYNPVLSPRGVHNHFPAWRNYSEYGTGGVGDWGAHHLDIAQWGLGMDNSGPVEVRPPGKGRDQGVTLVYANGVTVLHKGGFGVSFYGTEGQVFVNRQKFKFVQKGEVIAEYTENTKGTSIDAQVVKAEKAFLKDAKIKLYNSTSHQDDFLACVASRKKPITSEQVGGRSAICCHLMNQAYLHKQVMKWDPDKFAFVGGTGDPKWLTRDARDPWKKT